MPALNQDNQRYVEIIGVGTAHPRVIQWEHDDPLQETRYLSPGKLCPDTAFRLVSGISTALARRFDTNLNALTTRVRVSPSQRIAGHLDTRASLLFCPLTPDEAQQVDAMRSMAACLLAGLRRPPTPSAKAEGEQFLLPTEAPTSPAALADLPLGALLGTRIAEPLAAWVANRPRLDFADRFREAPRQNLESETFEVCGRVLTTKTGGRYRSVGVRGQRVEPLRTEFNHPKVVFEEALREPIARAVGEPAWRLRMTITRKAVWTGRLQPLATYTLDSLRFED